MNRDKARSFSKKNLTEADEGSPVNYEQQPNNHSFLNGLCLVEIITDNYLSTSKYLSLSTSPYLV